MILHGDILYLEVCTIILKLQVKTEHEIFYIKCFIFSEYTISGKYCVLESNSTKTAAFFYYYRLEKASGSTHVMDRINMSSTQQL